MNFYAQTSNSVSNILRWLPLIISLLLLQCLANSSQNTSVGVIIDFNSVTGKQQRTAMQIATQNFNNYSNTHNLILFFKDSGRNPLQTASAAEELITKKKVRVIIGMETWQEAALVADLGAKFQVPIISFSSPSLVPSSSMQLRWPFFIQMTQNHTAQMNFIADIVHAFNSQKVIAIYEDNPYSNDYGMLTLLSDALEKVNSKIEYQLVLPPFTSLSDPKGVVLDELLKLLPQKSHVFVVLQASLPMVNHLFREAKKIGLLERESCWIINEEITSMLAYVDKSVLSSMKGVLGIKTNISTSSSGYTQLQENFQADPTETVESRPGSNALLAYDSITIVTKALEKMNTNSSSSRILLEEMLSSNFNGLSGDIRFKERQLSCNPILSVIKVVDNDKKHMELDFWNPKLKFARSLIESINDSTPKTWKVHTNTNPLKVAIPMNPAFDNFLKFSPNEPPTGFCIELFKEIREILSEQYFGLPYEFHAFNESYDELMYEVINELYDVIVGDVTILANRSKLVSFTQPYTESGLSLIFPEETEGSAWLFMKPFSMEMWIATVGILIYTMITIWFLEHHLNPEFGGPLKTQISTTLWFAFSTLFFAHKEKINSNSARIVVGVWLFLVFVLTSSYTANLSSLLTVQKLRSDRDIEWLKQNNLPVGCDNSSTFVKDYLVQVYNFPRPQVIDVEDERDMVDKFKSKKIAALFVESPYEKVFLNKYCKDYTATTAAYKFGGMGFVFQKGDPMAKDFSEAILTLAENGKLKALEETWLTPSNECSNNSPSPETESLTLGKFWGLYIICATTSTICLILALLKKYFHYHNHYEEEAQLSQRNVTTESDDDHNNNNDMKRVLRSGTGLYNGNLMALNKSATFGGSVLQGVRRRNSPRLESVTISDELNNPQRSQSAVISFAAPTITPPLMKVRWPFLVRLANNGTPYIKSIAEIVQAYSWKRVVAIYEDEGYGGDNGMLALLAEALQDVGSMIEHHLVLSPISSLHDPQELVSEEIIKLNQTQSRVFIVLKSSLEMAIHLFKEASKVGLVDKESVWIIPESITNLLDSVNKSAISYMEGALGIKTYYSERSKEYQEFEAQFRRNFRSKNPEEDNRYPGFYALQAYDSINIVTQAINRITNSSSKTLLREILSSNFLGLSGHIQLEAGQLMQKNLVLRIVNVAGKSYKELCFWTQKHGLTTTLHAGQGGNTECLKGVRWPGNLDRDPKGWNMPTKQNQLKIAIRSRTSFSKFVKVEYGHNKTHDKYSGFCIEIFEKVHRLLGYDLPYKYHSIDGTYNDLVQLVYNKTFDAVIGDMTIIEERLQYVDFTVPYAESGLSMIVPAASEESAWMFTKPFSWELWLVTGAITIYTMLVVWYLEREPNPEFHGNWKIQLSTALWFTVSSLFFAHREKMHSNLTRVVMVSWLFLVLIINSSYTASLSSMLTVKKLRSNVTDIQWLKDNNKKIGCDGDSFVRTFLEKVERFKPENIINITDEYKYDEAFANNSIAAAFLELPYEKVFLCEYCKKYTGSTPRTRFGGLGFMFQKGSPVARDVSKAILHLSENADLKRLEEKWLITSQDCSNNATSSDDMGSLNLRSLWVLYVISGATSTICLLISTIKCLKHSQPHEDLPLPPEGNDNTSDESDCFSRSGHVSINDTPEHSQELAICHQKR